MVPFPKNENFVGESQVRRFVEQRRNTQDPLQSHVSVALHGLGGVGKTQDVLDFVYSCRKSHSIFWIYCESPTRFDEDYRKLAKLANIPGYKELDSSQDTRTMVKDWLESKDSGDWILVLDNADNKTDFFPGSTGAESDGLAKYIPKCAKGTIVITTRDYEVAQQLAVTKGVLTKAVMSLHDARSLYQQHYHGGVPYHEADCDKLLDELQYLPLAITQVASYLQINRQTITPTEYLAEFQRTKASRQQLLSRPVHNIFRPELPISSRRNAETVLTTFEITFQQINTQSPLAGSILRLIACINAQGIPRALLAELTSQSENDISFREALGRLVNFSLLQCQTDSTEATYTVHSLVHLAIQYFMSPEEKVEAIETTARVLAKIIPSGGQFKNWPRWRPYHPHCTAFLSYADNSFDNIDIAAICYSMAHYLTHRGHYRDSHSIADRAVTIRKCLLGHDHPQTLQAMLLLADGVFRIGMRDKAEELQVQIVALSEKVLGGNHPETSIAMSQLAVTLQNRGRLDEAEPLQRKVLETRKVISGEDHPETLIAMNNLAVTLRLKGRLDEAEPLQRKVLETRKVVLGEDHPNTLSAISNLALTLKYSGRLDEAEPLQRKVLETRKVISGEDHPETLIAMNNLAVTLRLKGRLDEAEPLQRKVLETRKVVLGEDHPNTLSAISNLALTLKYSGRLDEAEPLQRKVLETRKVISGEDHPETLIAMNNLAVTLQNRGRLDEAEPLQRKVLETRKVVLGEDHPNTLSAISNLAVTLRLKGRLDKAEPLQRKVLEARKVVFGEDHPETLIAMSNLAVTLQNRGRLDEAEPLQRKVLETRKVVSGEDHPETLRAMNNLAYTYYSKKSLDIAINMMEEVVSRRFRILGSEHEYTRSSMVALQEWKKEREE
ncbi:hypothetical protein BZA77DRAFT_248567 [Pyronema omphalodes]|nr:hypothetical protein BZA77DRAFT_248567 [Pyronema omphalodes]